jgi:hypothetical protein
MQLDVSGLLCILINNVAMTQPHPLQIVCCVKTYRNVALKIFNFLCLIQVFINYAQILFIPRNIGVIYTG